MVTPGRLVRMCLDSRTRCVCEWGGGWGRAAASGIDMREKIVQRGRRCDHGSPVSSSSLALLLGDIWRKCK